MDLAINLSEIFCVLVIEHIIPTITHVTYLESVHPISAECWPAVCDAGPALTKTLGVHLVLTWVTYFGGGGKVSNPLAGEYTPLLARRLW